MESGKKKFVRSLRRLIFCIIVTLLFGRGIVYCQGSDEFEGLSFGSNRSFARAELTEDLTLEILNKHEHPFSSPLAHSEPDSRRSVPVPPAGVTVGVCIAAMIVGWLRRRVPAELPR
jgi:hypothetical protein